MDPKKQLQSLIDQIKTKQFREGEAKGLTETIGGEITKQLTPAFKELAKELKGDMASAFKDAVNSIKVDMPEQQAPTVHVNVPDVVVPDINVPEPKVTVNVPAPIVNVPKADAPVVNFPSEMAIKREAKPFPVMMVDQVGKPFNFPVSTGGGKADFFTIKGFEQSAYADLQNADGRIKVSVETGGSGLTDTELRATAVPVSQLSGARWSTEATQSGTWNIGTVTTVTGVTNSLQATLIDSSGIGYSGSNPVPVVFSATSSTASSIIDSSGVQYSGSNPVPVALISGSLTSTGSYLLNGDGTYRDSMPVTGTVTVGSVTATVGATILNGEGVARDTWGSSQVGTWNIGTVTTVTGLTNSIQASLIDSGGVQYSGSNPLTTLLASNSNLSTITASESYAIQDLPAVFAQLYAHNVTDVSRLHTGGFDSAGALRTSQATDSVSSVVINSGTITTVTSVTNTIAALNVDSSGVGYSGSNPLPITIVGGASSTMNAVYTRQTNPTAVASDYVPLSADDLGRQLMRPIQVRDLIKTAYVSLTTGTETTLLTSTAGTFSDLIMITATNNSTAATQLDIRATTAGNIIHTMYLPATTGPVGFSPSIPWPQDSTGNSWTIDMPDQTGTTVYVSALFSQEI